MCWFADGVTLLSARCKYKMVTFYSLWITGSLFPSLKWPEHVCNHSSASSSEVKNEWNHTSTLACGSYRDKLILTSSVI